MSLRSIFKDMGPANGLLYVTSRVLEKLSSGRVRIVRYLFVAQPIGRPGVKPMRADAATELRSVHRGDPLEAEFPRPPHILSQRWDAGARCTAAVVKGSFAGFIWIQRDRYIEDELRSTYVLAEPAISMWDYDVYVVPAFRIGRTMARLWSHVDAEQAAQGVRWSFSRISAFNTASLSSHAKLGTVPCGSAFYLVMGALQLAWVPKFPHLHLSFGPGNGPVVHLNPPAADGASHL